MLSSPLTCLIVDDEPLAQDNLIRYINTVPYLTLTGVASNVFEAMSLMESSLPDIVLLDIQLPQLNGMDWLRTLESRPPNVIITTGSENSEKFAVEGFELNVIDFLLKPIRLERFVQAVNKAANRTRERAMIATTASAPPSPVLLNYFFVKEGKDMVRINHSDILCITAMDDYVRIHKKDNLVVTNMRMREIEELLPSPPFHRLNRSTIVHQDCVDRVANNHVTLCNKIVIDVTPKFQPAFETMMNMIQNNKHV